MCIRKEPWENVDHISSPIYYNSSKQINDAPSYLQFNSLELTGKRLIIIKLDKN